MSNTRKVPVDLRGELIYCEQHADGMMFAPVATWSDENMRDAPTYYCADELRELADAMDLVQRKETS